MALLSTNTKLIKVGQDYSAGSGISIEDKVISVTGGLGNTYSAGENISIYNQGEQLYISSKDWTNDIANASANAYNEAVAQIPSPFDPSFISGQVDNKLDTTAFTAWQNGQYSTDIQTIEGQISNKLDESAFRQVSASFLTAINIPESATWNEVSQAYEQASATYLTSISIPESAVWQDVSTTVQTNSAQWAEGGGAFPSSADEAITSYQTNSGNYLIKTASMPTIGRNLTGNGVFGLAVGARSKSFDYGLSIGEWTNKNVKNARSNAAIGYSAHAYGTGSQAFGEQVVVSAGMAIGRLNKTSACSFVIGNGTSNTSRNDIFIINYDGSVSAAGKISANGIELGTGGDEEVNALVHSNSGNWNTVTDKLDTSSFINIINNFYPADNPAGFITGVSIPESATWNEVSTAVQINSAQWADVGVISSYTRNLSPYGSLINSLNDIFISAFISNSADSAKFANNANSANSANYAETVNETYLENKGFTRNLSSEYGTISVINNNIIESTNSAIVRTINEGFVSSFEGKSVGPEGPATYSWDKSLPNTTINLDIPTCRGETLTYSANTDLTGKIVLPKSGPLKPTINIPNATEFKVWADKWIYIYRINVSAADTFETVVGELAWASALPTYEYDNTNKISAINGSALAGGSDIPSGTMNVSGFEYNAVNEISAYNGSAIAQYGAEKQWLVHDDTLVHAANSAQYALGVNLSAVAQLLGVDETVLFSGNLTGNGASAQLSEPIQNFERIKVYGHTDDGLNSPWFTEFYPDENSMMDVGAATNNAGWGKWFSFTITTGGLYTNMTGRVITFGSTTWGNLDNWGTTRVVGIGRKS